MHSYQGFHLDLGRPRRRLELPTGTATLLLNFGEPLQVTHLLDGRRSTVPTGSATVFGPSTRAALGEHDGRLRGLVVVLAPWAAFTLFGAAMDQLADTAIELPDLLGSRAGDLTGDLAATSNWPERFGKLETVLAGWAATGPAHSPPIARAWQKLCRTARTIPIPALANEVGWCQRQLESRFRQQIGLTPKAATRILRLQRALPLLTEGRPAAEVASATGYHDQAHLGHECKTMTGHTPGQFLACRAAAYRDPSVVDRAEGRTISILPPAANDT